jgi:hypothetical protein
MPSEPEPQSPIPIGSRVHVSDPYYTGEAIVLEYDPELAARWEYDPELAARWDELGGPYYCHLLDLCDHEWCGPDERGTDDDCRGKPCRGWYAATEADVLAPPPVRLVPGHP